MVAREAQLWNIGAQYLPQRGSIIPQWGSIFCQKGLDFPYEAKATSKIAEYWQKLFIYNACQQINAQYHRNLPFISIL